MSLIDDGEDSSCFVRVINGKFQVKVTSGGKAGLKIADEIRPHLILFDIMMAKME